MGSREVVRGEVYVKLYFTPGTKRHTVTVIFKKVAQLSNTLISKWGLISSFEFLWLPRTACWSLILG